MGTLFPEESDELLALLSQRGMTKRLQLQKMLEYISLSTCRREFLVTYFDETLHEKIPFVVIMTELLYLLKRVKWKILRQCYHGKNISKNF